MSETIFQPAVIMMEVTVIHQTLLIGQDVPIILHLLAMEHVKIISNPKPNAIMMVETAAISPWLQMENVNFSTISIHVDILMEETVNLMDSIVMSH